MGRNTKETNMDLNLTDRIKDYLTRQPDWVPASTIYALARQRGYTTDAIKSALDTISHTPPFASWRVMVGDTKANRVGGMYYRWYDMKLEEELQRMRESDAVFEAL